jgi:glycosyltransferase involved in cell wall biosynthesis
MRAAAPPLVVCGEGAHGGRLRDRARELGADVRFIGHLAPETLPGAYSAATCFVHAGAVETFGLSVLEAMACGAAVLGARGGAVPEVVGAAGLLAPADDAGEFQAQLRALLADAPRRAALGEAARRRALDQFSLERMHGSYAAAIESVCAPCASRS